MPTANLQVVDNLGLGALEPFRSEVASWLAANVPPNWREAMTGASHDKYVTFQQSWLRVLADAGYAAPHWPAEWGGGLSLAQRVILAEEMTRADAPRLSLHSMSLFHAAATLLGAGTDAQRARHLPAILAGEVWCQLFSEPDAGSDLASLRTRAVPAGDVYIVTGQKVWSSHAHEADYGLLLARTDPGAPKRQGISYFIVDMRTPGIEVRPIVQSTGQSDFNEVFLDEVEIPVENRLGAENDGWAVAQSTLAAERGTTMLDLVERLRATRARLARDVEEKLEALGDGAEAALLRHEYASIHAEIEILRLLCFRTLDNLVRQGEEGPSASVLKLTYSEALQRLDRFGLQVNGLGGQLERPPQRGMDWESGNWVVDYLASWAWTIGGGTSEILRNVVAERVLGLPRDPYVPVEEPRRG